MLFNLKKFTTENIKWEADLPINKRLPQMWFSNIILIEIVFLLTVKMQNGLDFFCLRKKFIFHYMGTEVPLKNRHCLA